MKYHWHRGTAEHVAHHKDFALHHSLLPWLAEYGLDAEHRPPVKSVHTELSCIRLHPVHPSIAKYSPSNNQNFFAPSSQLFEEPCSHQGIIHIFWDWPTDLSFSNKVTTLS